MNRTVIALTAAAFLAAGRTTNPYAGEPQLSRTAIGAGTGAALGTAAGKAQNRRVEIQIVPLT